MDGERTEQRYRSIPEQWKKLFALFMGVLLVLALHPRVSFDGGIRSGRTPVGMGETGLSIRVEITLTLELSVSVGPVRITSRLPVSIDQSLLIG